MIRKQLYAALMTSVMTTIVGGMSLMHPAKVEASGFPTVDIAALIQRLQGYLTQLAQYSEALTTTTTTISQLVQMYEDYNQVLREYEHYLAQIRGLQRFISDADWRALMRAMEPYYGSSDFSAIVDLDPKEEGFYEDVRELLDQYTIVPRTGEELEPRLAGINADRPENILNDAQRWQIAYARQMDIYQQVADNEKAAKERDELNAAFDERIQNLGDESDLASIQTVATGVAMMLNQQQAALRLSNQQLMSTETLSGMRAAENAAALDRELSRLEWVRENPIESFTVDLDDF